MHLFKITLLLVTFLLLVVIVNLLEVSVVLTLLQLELMPIHSLLVEISLPPMVKLLLVMLSMEIPSTMLQPSKLDLDVALSTKLLTLVLLDNICKIFH